MATYRTIAATEDAVESFITAELADAWTNNVLAIAEGDATAPKIQFAALDTWFTTAGAVGTYVFAKRGTGTADVAFGSTIAGSSLVPTSAVTAVSVSGSATADAAAALSGTWRCMGQYDHVFATGGTYNGATLWMRIS